MNTTSVIDVSGLVSSLSARGVEKQLRRLPGVSDVQVNYVGGGATVVHDATLTNVAALQAQVERCGYHCRGESVPDHLCEPHAKDAMAHDMGHVPFGSTSLLLLHASRSKSLPTQCSRT
ncbi:heavy-metal-associated domain-containing protein [Thiomonas arsenitoxydans]|uniref:heavy-metal-associated domain-containing protein n=1 Tax=Thiomonas arsenitoxydans (strain DSM 22701 / CIP 110005 / 3As) TaxID=426114 RepID=UPI0023F143CA|nr:heavy metal-associated domain-containing protein [Thiomonas arsenitoxydans]